MINTYAVIKTNTNDVINMILLEDTTIFNPGEGLHVELATEELGNKFSKINNHKPITDVEPIVVETFLKNPKIAELETVIAMLIKDIDGLKQQKQDKV